jgi:hypothetical protein
MHYDNDTFDLWVMIAARRISRTFSDGAYVTMDNDRDFLVTATVQIIVRAEDRVIARLIAAETLRDYIADSPYPNDVMNGLTIDDVEDLMEED